MAYVLKNDLTAAALMKLLRDNGNSPELACIRDGVWVVIL